MNQVIRDGSQNQQRTLLDTDTALSGHTTNWPRHNH